MELKKKCNCKVKKDIKKLVQSIDDINLSSSRNYKQKRGYLDKIIIKLLKYLTYIILIVLIIILFIPILLLIFLYSVIFKKSIKLKIPIKHILK